MNTQTSYAYKSLLTILFLFCNSSLSLSTQQVSSSSHCSIILLFFYLLYHSTLLLLYRSSLLLVLQYFSSSTGLLSIMFFCHSVLLLLCLSFALFLICISFHSVHQLNFMLNTFSFLLSYYFILFPYRTTKATQSHSYSFI
jgi:hypothetical protein